MNTVSAKYLFVLITSIILLVADNGRADSKF